MNEPDYQDRGLLKWLGFYLSDHTELINKEKTIAAKFNPSKPSMESHEIKEIINQAIIRQQIVSIQKEERDLQGRFPDDIIGIIEGGDELGLFISGHKINYDEIRNIQIVPFSKWSNLS
ncbi:hypothetical protein [Enterococcus pallens]|uniref:DNA-directed RNA polymerase beta subunit n=1 Tax=Enterococcus pallens ATCC BAA-351 TaxID=1158607 RepID=R2QIG7_9ENTE|nr:hypothetical protein [Enterococcus pallens]EOH96407.1 hypothetical protein UAU_01058 [Enterococcus pallens ATCC BAA-351]EOU14380.1 hypothetical protein I588_04736 [Enterococcus pallens ATCC BAA-351]